MNKLDRFFTKLAHDLDWEYDNPNINTDHPKCPNCGSIMNFYGKDNQGNEYTQGEAYWKCDSCGYSFTETQVREYDSEEY